MALKIGLLESEVDFNYESKSIQMSISRNGTITANNRLNHHTCTYVRLHCNSTVMMRTYGHTFVSNFDMQRMCHVVIKSSFVSQHNLDARTLQEVD